MTGMNVVTVHDSREEICGQNMTRDAFIFE